MEKKVFLVAAMMLAGAVCLGGSELYPPGQEVAADEVLDLQLIPIPLSVFDFSIAPDMLSFPGSGIAVPAPVDPAWEYFPEDDWGYYFSGCFCEMVIFDPVMPLDDYLFITDIQVQLVIPTDSVPEPATISLLVLGAAALLRKRK